MSRIVSVLVRWHEEMALSQLALSFENGNVLKVSFLGLRCSAMGRAHGPLRDDLNSGVSRVPKRGALFSDRVDKNLTYETLETSAHQN